MSTVRELADAMDSAIQRIEVQKRDMIAAAPKTFERIPWANPPRGYGKERYVIVYGDGSFPKYLAMFTQRPAALKTARFRQGTYVWDIRTNEILDGDGKVLMTQVGSLSQT